MNPLFQVIILGVIQGLTEFFPISSSAHLVILQHFFSIKKDVLLLDSILHAGTLTSIFLVFYRDIILIIKDFPLLLRRERKESEGLRMLYFIITGTIPTAFIGFFFRNDIERFFNSPKLVGFFLLLTSFILFLTKFTKERNREKAIHSFLIGIFQGLALLPGISRSGATISSALALGWKRELAFKFSFLLSIPAVLGANILEISQHLREGFNFKILLAGFLASFIAGLISLKILSPITKKGKIFLFSIYCLLAGLSILIFF
ncbi:MAG: undecaprenyl-diphosphate phosphatase [Candidatus Aminicenantia bacterium]